MTRLACLLLFKLKPGIETVIQNHQSLSFSSAHRHFNCCFWPICPRLLINRMHACNMTVLPHTMILINNIMHQDRPC